jgi:hypothetical protein
MLLKNKFIQVNLLSATLIIGSLLAAGCSPSNNGSATVLSPNQPAISSPAQPKASPPAQNSGLPANQPAASPSNLPAKPAASSEQQSPANPSPSRQINDSMTKVAAILGIDQQKLEDAFTQARVSLGDKGPMAPPTGSPMPAPTGTSMPSPPSGTVMPIPSGTPSQPPSGAVPSDVSKELLAKVASILGIDQQKLEDAFNQVMKQQ